MTSQLRKLCCAGGVAMALTVTGALTAGPAIAAPAPASGLAPTAVKIVSPTPASPVTGKTISIKVRAGKQVTGIDALLGNRVISWRFHRHGKAWTAALPRTAVRSGYQRLLVQAQTKHGTGTSDLQTFVVGRRAPRLLRGVKTTGRNTSTVRVTARTRTVTSATMTINGHPVADVDRRGWITRHSWQLTARDGLRNGRNRVVLTVLGRRGTVATRSWTFRHHQPTLLGATAAPTLGAQGLYINTALSTSASSSVPDTLTIGGNSYTSTGVPGGAKIFVQLDEKTLAPVASAVDGSELSPQPGTITIIVWENDDVAFADNADGARIWIGDTIVADNESVPFFQPPFDKAQEQTNNAQTTLHGWLERGAGTDPATWTDSDMLQVQTRAPGSPADSNTIQVGQQSATATLPAGATGGFQLVTLDNDGQLSDRQTYALTGNPTADTTTENQLAQELQQDTNPKSPSVTVILEGFGSLPAISSTGALAQQITAIGGNADVISRFGPNQKPDANGGEYALITGRYTTPKGAVWRAQETNSERTGYGSLNALLVRDATQNDYVPMTASAGVPDPSYATSQQLMPLIYQAPSPWTDWVPDGNGGLRAPTVGEQAAFGDIAAQMQSNGWVSKTNELCPNAPDPVRGALCNSDATALESIANEVTGLQFDQPTGTAGGYDKTVFDAVRTDISQEFNNASTIRGGIDQYQQIFGTAEINGAVDAPVIGAAIQSDLRKSSSSTGSNMLNFMSALTGILSVFDPELGLTDALDFGDSMTFMSSAFTTMGMMEPDSGPGEQLADNVQVTQATAAANLQHSLQTASDQLSIYGDYLASDPVKLIKAAALFAGPLALSGTTKDDTEHGAEYAANQYLWGTLLAPAYNIWTGPATLGTNPTCFYGDPVSNEWDPFSNADSNDEWSSVSGTTPTTWWIGQSVGAGNIGQQGAIALPAKTADQLMGSPDIKTSPTATTNVGAVMPYFAQSYLSFQALPINPATAPPVSVSGCMPHVY
jgi:hypothetical protein